MAEDKRWERRPDVESVVEYCVQRWHRHLEGATVVALGRPTPGKKLGREVWASLKIASPKERALWSEESEDIDYVLVVAVSVWNRIPAETRIALVDHELCHAAGWDAEAEAWLVRGHDVEEFGQVVERHGAWQETLRAFIETAQRVQLPQLSLRMEEATKA